MSTLDLDNPATRIADLIEQLDRMNGESVSVVRGGQVVAKLVRPEEEAAPDSPLPPREGGEWAGKIWMAEDFNAPLPKEVEDAFYENNLELPPAKELVKLFAGGKASGESGTDE
jgi:hypothetical protein